MKAINALLAATYVVILGGCATADLSQTAFYQSPPRSVLVAPVVNRSLDVDASNYVLTTLTIPIAELGYYVFPVNTTKVVLEQEGLYEPEMVRKMEPGKLCGLFGADAVLYVTINRWDARYLLLSTTVTVDFDYELLRNDGSQLWKAKKTMQYSPQQQNQGGNPLAGLIAQAISAAMTRAAPNYIPLTQQANYQVFVTDAATKWPPGPYAKKQ
ncbi:MAG TPA: GNA1162 family protein [Burkholderiales bacterium]|nr:GNA1162 family protein [Burkholderiales bacterium]